MVGYLSPDMGLVSNVAPVLAVLLTPEDCAQPFPAVCREFHQRCRGAGSCWLDRRRAAASLGGGR